MQADGRCVVADAWAIARDAKVMRESAVQSRGVCGREKKKKIKFLHRGCASDWKIVFSNSSNISSAQYGCLC